jgi:hypothetical protein
MDMAGPRIQRRSAAVNDKIVLNFQTADHSPGNLKEKAGLSLSAIGFK